MSDQTKKPVYINRENFTDKIKSYLRLNWTPCQGHSKFFRSIG